MRVEVKGEEKKACNLRYKVRGAKRCDKQVLKLAMTEKDADAEDAAAEEAVPAMFVGLTAFAVPAENRGVVGVAGESAFVLFWTVLAVGP